MLGRHGEGIEGKHKEPEQISDVAMKQNAMDGEGNEKKLKDEKFTLAEEFGIKNVVIEQPEDSGLEDLSSFWSDFTDPLFVEVKISNLQSERQYFLDEMERLRQKAEQKELQRVKKEELQLAKQKELQNAKEGDNDAGKKEAEILIIPPSPEPAKINIRISKDGMIAWVYVSPPMHDGAEVTVKNLLDVMLKNGIKVGIKREVLELIEKEKLYEQALTVATGCPAKNGVDGSTTDHYNRGNHLEFLEDENGQVDFKNQNWLQMVREGEVICDITQPVPSVDGFTIVGRPVRADILGRKPDLPVGRNTVASEDGAQICAAITGHIACINGKFSVEEVLQISGDVNNTTGNLNFIGDIVIQGDIRSGFIVEAEGSVIVKGSVEGSIVNAGGNITVGLGVIGSGQAKLTAGGDIHCKYMENAESVAQGGIYTNSILWSHVYAKKEVVVKTGRGIIIGGSIASCGLIEAKIIGSQSRRMTELYLRDLEAIPVVQEQAYERELTQLRYNLRELEKNIRFLKEANREDKKHLLEQFILAWNSLSPREGELLELIQGTRKNKSVLHTSRIYCNNLFPDARIQIGEAVMLVHEEHNMCNIFYSSDGEIIIGTR